ncbi:MAG: putative toxin-antitoxin system toxin component, PIN family [bacterium]|nr:putative toxin-antitoxin system toxin component, PIN family [bacterium]
MNQWIFVDSDVIISSLISNTGAAHLLLFNIDNPIKRYISIFSLKELKIVTERLEIDQKILTRLIKYKFIVVKIKKTLAKIKQQYSSYVNDPNDAHIVTGAIESKSRFLITYNIKDYKIENIKRDFGIIIFKPAQYLQYLRSIK